MRWSLGSANFNDLFIRPGLKFSPRFQCSDFEKCDRKGCPYTHLKLYGFAIDEYDGDDKLMVQTLSKSLTWAVLSCFTKVKLLKVKSWVDLAWLAVEHYKFNTEIAP